MEVATASYVDQQPMAVDTDDGTPFSEDLYSYELAVMRKESSQDNMRERAYQHGNTIFTILVTYLLEFWRHELEIKQPQRFFSAVTGFQSEACWWNHCVEEDLPEARRKTRWQEVAENFFGQILHLDHCGQEFDGDNPKHLRGLAKILERGDESIKTIVRNYVSTIG